MVCAHCKRHAAAEDKCISWRATGDIGGGVHQGSLGDSELRTRLGGDSELGAVASTKAVWWDLCLASLLAHLFSSYSGLGLCREKANLWELWSWVFLLNQMLFQTTNQQHRSTDGLSFLVQNSNCWLF